MEGRFQGYTFTRDDIKFTITNVNKVKGEAQISIRKGKQIVVFEYEVECSFRGETQTDDCEGNFRVNDINESDLDFEISSINITKENKIGGKARQILKQCLRNEIILLVKDMREQLMAFENDPQKLAEDQKRRQENELRLRQVIAEKGAEKDRLLEEQKTEEARLREAKMSKGPSP